MSSKALIDLRPSVTPKGYRLHKRMAEQSERIMFILKEDPFNRLKICKLYPIFGQLKSRRALVYSKEAR